MKRRGSALGGCILAMALSSWSLACQGVDDERGPRSPGVLGAAPAPTADPTAPAASGAPTAPADMPIAGQAAPALPTDPAPAAPGDPAAAPVGGVERVFDAGTDPARNRVTAGTICERLAAIQCAGEAYCCNAPGRDKGSCVENVRSTCQNDLMADQIAQNPIVAFDPVHAESAFTRLEQMASQCDPAIASFGESMDGMRGMFRGTVEAGGPCRPANPLDTASAAASLASCADPANVSCLPMGLTAWSCLPRSVEGGNCFTDVNCTPGLFCDNPNLSLSGSTCKLRQPAGIPCQSALECASLACTGGLCAEPTDTQAVYCLQQQ